MFAIRGSLEKPPYLGARGYFLLDNLYYVVEAAHALEIGKENLHILKLFILDGEHVKCKDCESRQKKSYD